MSSNGSASTLTRERLWMLDEAIWAHARAWELAWADGNRLLLDATQAAARRNYRGRRLSCGGVDASSGDANRFDAGVNANNGCKEGGPAMPTAQHGCDASDGVPGLRQRHQATSSAPSRSRP